LRKVGGETYTKVGGGVGGVGKKVAEKWENFAVIFIIWPVSFSQLNDWGWHPFFGSCVCVCVVGFGKQTNHSSIGCHCQDVLANSIDLSFQRGIALLLKRLFMTGKLYHQEVKG